MFGGTECPRSATWVDLHEVMVQMQEQIQLLSEALTDVADKVDVSSHGAAEAVALQGEEVPRAASDVSDVVGDRRLRSQKIRCLDWPLNRAEQCTALIGLYDKDVQAADCMLRASRNEVAKLRALLNAQDVRMSDVGAMYGLS